MFLNMSEIIVFISTTVSLIVSSIVLVYFRKFRKSQSVIYRLPTLRQGALVPVSPYQALPNLSNLTLEQSSKIHYEQAALVIEFNELLSSELELLRKNNEFSTIKGPVLKAIASILDNPVVAEIAQKKTGYYLVRASRDANFMIANGVKVAQEFGKSTQAGPKAVIVGGAVTGAVALSGTAVVAVALAATAEYILTAKIDRISKTADLVHNRQLAEALSAADHVSQLVQRLRGYDNPSDWPEVLMSPLATAHHELIRQTLVAIRLRNLILDDDIDDKAQPSDPLVGNHSSAFYELAAGYELLMVAAQAAAARLVHALSHGDAVTTAELEWQLHDHIKKLKEHQEVIDSLADRKSPWFKKKWGRSLINLRNTFSEVISIIEANEYQFALMVEGSEVEMFALPAAPIYLPETAPLSDMAGE
jgi:hypothetical protein